MNLHSKISPKNQPILTTDTPTTAQAWNLSRVGIILACLFFIVPLCSLPPARIGYYSQVETSVLAFWALSALSYVWIYFLNKKNPRLVYQTSNLPIVWGPILLGLVTILLAIFHPLPLRDFVGSGQIGEGALTFIASGIMACHFSILTRISVYRKLIFGGALFVGLLICTLTIIGSMDSPLINWRYWKWAAFYFPDFLAFIDIALITVYFYMRKDLKGMTYLYDTIALSVFASIAYYASNKSLSYGLIIAGFSTLGIWILPTTWRRNMLQMSFFGLTLSLTLLIVFYDDFSSLLPDTLKSLGHLSTLTSRTWLSKVSLVDLWLVPLNEEWIQQIVIGNGWGTFSNISAANMFLIDQVSIFSGKEYQPSWELVNRDLLHTHNILTNIFHSLGLLGVSLYLFTQYKVINSLSRPHLFLGATFLIAYQVQLLLWFQFLMTIPFTLLALSLLCRERSSTFNPSVMKPKLMLSFAGVLLLFSCLQGFMMIGYNMGLKPTADKSSTELVETLTTAPYMQLEAAFGAQRQVVLARSYSNAMQAEFEKTPQKLVTHSLKLVHHLNSLTKDGNYLANTLAINILSELASKPETLKLLDKDTFKAWEQLARDHVKFMPYRSDILLPFFNLYQTLGKEALVMDLTKSILEQNPHDPIALWFMGSSQLKSSAHFDRGMCMLQESIRDGVERFMPIPPPLKSKIMTYANLCP